MHHYEDCLVSFIDILGFRSLISKKSAEEIYNIIKTLEKYTQPDDHGEKSRSMDEVRLYSRAFAQSISDAIARVRPYNTQYRDGAFVYELIDLLHAQIELVNLGILIRAGMTVGKCHAGYDGEGPFFGPALIKAYEIESVEASFPRIVIDEAVLKAHRTDNHLRREDNTLESEIKTIKGILTTDEDGKHFIDYLKCDEEFDDLGTYFQFLETHSRIIRSGLKENLKNSKIYPKYQWLKDYHNKNINKWVANITKDEHSENDFLNEYEIDAESFFSPIFINE